MRRRLRKKKKAWQQYMGITFMMLIGVVCGVFMGAYIERSGSKSLYEEILSLAGLFIGMYVALFVHTIIHEAGHLIFGLLSEYGFSSFRIGSFMWMKENETIQFRRLSVAGTGGQCLMSPPDREDGKIPVILYNLGGAISNMIAGVLFLGLFFAVQDIPIFSTLMLIFAVAGFMAAMINGIPMRMGTVDNDGYNVFSLTRNAQARRSFWVQLKVNEQLARGIRLKDMPDEWFAVPADEAMKNSMVAVMGVFACNRLMDAENFEEADKLMAHMLAIESGMTGLHRKLLVCDRMYIELIGENRKDVLNRMLGKEQKQFMKQMKNFPSVLRTEYVYALLCERNIEKAQNIKVRFEKWAKRYPYPNDVKFERVLMEKAE